MLRQRLTAFKDMQFEVMQKERLQLAAKGSAARGIQRERERERERGREREREGEREREIPIHI